MPPATHRVCAEDVLAVSPCGEFHRGKTRLDVPLHSLPSRARRVGAANRGDAGASPTSGHRFERSPFTQGGSLSGFGTRVMGECSRVNN